MPASHKHMTSKEHQKEVEERILLLRRSGKMTSLEERVEEIKSCPTCKSLRERIWSADQLDSVKAGFAYRRHFELMHTDRLDEFVGLKSIVASAKE